MFNRFKRKVVLRYLSKPRQVNPHNAKGKIVFYFMKSLNLKFSPNYLARQVGDEFIDIKNANNIKLAYDISEQAHKEQLDKGGNSYFEHPLYVFTLVNSIDEKIVALLHDVVEDTTITLLYLKQQGFSDDIIFAIDCLTKRKHESYDDYLKRVCSSDIAIVVKIADMTHNSDITRIPNPTQKDFDRVKKYKEKIEWLKEVTDNSDQK